MNDICIDAFKNLYIELKDNGVTAISPCCVNLPTRKVTVIDFYRDENLNSIRDDWKNNQFPSSCSICKKTENARYPSKRMGSNAWYQANNCANTDVELIRLDFWVGDTCNLRCVICGSDFSSAWKEELKIPVIERKININKEWQSLDLTKIKFIHFNGGEPLLSKEHVNFLDSIPLKSQVYLNYNTNGTVLPSDRLLKLWEEFKLVQIDVSIDDIDEQFEYQRYPAKWVQLTENLHWFINNFPVNCMFGVNTTVSILNQDNLTRLDQWLKTNFCFNRVTDPIEHRKSFAEGIFSLENIDSRKKDIVNFLNNCDGRRGTNWKTTFPSLVTRLLD